MYKKIERINKVHLDKYKEWRARCALTSDSWIDGKSSSFTNSFVNSLSGTIFPESIDDSTNSKYIGDFFELLELAT